MQLLEIHAGVRDHGSVSRRLCGVFLDYWRKLHPAATRTLRDIGLHPPSHPTALFTAANYTPSAQRIPEMHAALAESDALIDELLAADRILLALPMYNFSVPSTFKAWLDNIVRVNRTFTFDPASFTFGPLVLGRRALVIVSSAADYRAESPMAHLDHLTPYVRTIFGFIGISEVSFVYAPNQFASEEIREAAFAETSEELAKLAREW